MSFNRYHVNTDANIVSLDDIQNSDPSCKIKSVIRRGGERILGKLMTIKKSVPVWGIVCGCLLFAYFALFVKPIFLTNPDAMVFPQYLPSITPVGSDLRLMLSYSHAWLDNGSPYIGANLYPPLASLLFCPLALLPFKVAYVMITLLSVLAFVSVVLLLPLKTCPGADRTALVALTLAGLLSYGFQFEIERGQFNVLAATCVAWALFLYHSGKGRGVRCAAFLLFSVAVQLKLYPAIFVFAFTRNARDWKSNLVRWTALGAMNIILFWVLGASVFHAFIGAVSKQVNHPYVWIGNHSITSFVTLLSTSSLERYASVVGICGKIIPAACLTAILALAYVRGGRTSFKYVLAICAFLALLMPAVSHDYKLPIITMAFAFFVAETRPVGLDSLRGAITAVLLVGFSLLNVLTHFSYMLKPCRLQNNALVLMAACVVLLLLMLNEESCGAEIRVDRPDVATDYDPVVGK